MKTLWRRIVLRWQLITNFAYDWHRYQRHSFVLRSRTREHRKAMLHILAHSLEHGMALSHPRHGFGQEKAASLTAKLEAYLEDFGPDASTDWVQNVLTAYLEHHTRDGIDIAWLVNHLAALPSYDAERGVNAQAGGVEHVTKQDIEEATNFDFDRFMQMRHSVRQYSGTPVSERAIRRAVANAQCAPSVCNRQTCRVYALTEKEAIRQALTYQSGNAGFGHEIGALFVITANVQHLNLIGERYQGWIDGGIFAMALLLSLHAQGLGTCCLNWSVDKKRDRELREHLQIPEEELIITMMAAGHLKDDFTVPVSRRKPLDSVLILDPAGSI
jgi:nitroreductase